MEARRRATYADLEALPPNVVGELLGGELHVSPRPAPRHAQASSLLGVHLGGRFHLGNGGPGGWRILDEPELHLGQDVLVPDLAGWRRESLPTLPQTAFFATRPDWVCEVLSPSTARLDRIDKMNRYASAGVPWAWLVDPETKVIEVYELKHDAWLRRIVVGDEAEARLPPFDAVPFDVRTLWEG